jgi:hypothetical protein
MLSLPEIVKAASPSFEHMDANYAKAIKDLTKSITVGEVNVGYVGELVAQLLFILARDQMTIPSGVTSSIDADLASFINSEVDLSDFLHQFCNISACHSSGSDNLEALYPRGAATLRLSHFVSISYTLSKREELVSAYNRGAGLVCKAGQRGVDMIVPIKFSTSSPDSPGYSCLMIQAKDVQTFGHSDIEDTLSKLRIASAMPELALIPEVADNIVHLLISLGVADESSSRVMQASGRLLMKRRSQRQTGIPAQSPGSVPEQAEEAEHQPLGYNILGFSNSTFPALHRNLPQTAGALSTLFLRCGGDPTQHAEQADARRWMALQPLVHPDERLQQAQLASNASIATISEANEKRATKASQYSWVPPSERRAVGTLTDELSASGLSSAQSPSTDA